MAMNIVKLQNQLQSVPDEALIGYVQNPNGQVPSFLALAEITRRKEIRNAGQAQQAQAPTQTVAEQAISEGVAGLPVGEEMFTAPESGIASTGEIPAEYAQGGVVAFALGGSTDSEFKLSKPDGLSGPMFEDAGIIELIKRMRKDPKYAEKLRLERQNELRPYDEVVKDLKAKPKTESEFMFPKRDVVPLNYDRPTPKQIIQEKAAADAAAQNTGQPPMPAGAGIGALSFRPMQDNSAAYDKFQRPEQTAREKMAEMQELIGEDAGRAGRAARLEAMEARTAKDEETAPWMALAKAGFGIAAGKSPFAISNIGEGAQAGLADLAASRDRINNAREKQFEIADRMAQAERAEKVAAAKYGVESSEAIKARNEQNGLAKLDYKNRLDLANYNREFDVQKGNVEIGLQKAKLAQDAAQHAQTLKMYDDKIKASSGAIQARLVGEKRKAYLDAQTTLAPEIASILKKKYNGNSDDPMFQREREMLINGYVSNALSLTMDDMDARDSGDL